MRLRLRRRREPDAAERHERAISALLPFADEWKLPLNPEDLDEMAYAVLLYADSDSSHEEIDAAVHEQIEAHRVAWQRLSDRMGEELDRRYGSTPNGGREP